MSGPPKEPITAPRGPRIRCKGWPQEAALRCLMNNLEVAEKPEELIVYGGMGKAARNWDCYYAIVEALRQLESDESLLIQSGKPVAVFKTSPWAPRVLISNAMLVPAWSTLDHFLEYDAKGLTMYGQMTAGSWINIGAQGIIQGTYETYGSLARRHFGGSLKGKIVYTGGLGMFSGIMPLAVAMNEGVCLAVEVDSDRVGRRKELGYIDEVHFEPEGALASARRHAESGAARKIALVGNAATILNDLLERDFPLDVVTDQTSAHDPLVGYYPEQIGKEEADALRTREPKKYMELARETMVRHVKAMVAYQKKGAVVFDYGNNLRQEAYNAGYPEAFSYPGFVDAFIRPLFCEGRGPFRWICLSGDAEDLRRTDDAVLREFPEDKLLLRWIEKAREFVPIEGLPARVCYMGYGERDRFARVINRMVRRGELSAPVVFGRDHLDAGSVASPNRETENMKDGSDAIADWPILNALLSTACGATWVAVHNGGGVGIGYSTHAGLAIVADGTDEADEKIARAQICDPGIGVVRHADAGYDLAIETARKHGIRMPLLGK
ncbi:MAG: urocanate hydratase [Nitrospinota bacterium]